mmetsp:Transcript_105743/g.326133  ORF Transcript_105743/g.326133 Transcript_105743/m.326133 type:complete len:305 (+) Transcript_105743:171-1085(+)
MPATRSAWPSSCGGLARSARRPQLHRGPLRVPRSWGNQSSRWRTRPTAPTRSPTERTVAIRIRRPHLRANRSLRRPVQQRRSPSSPALHTRCVRSASAAKLPPLPTAPRSFPWMRRPSRPGPPSFLRSSRSALAVTTRSPRRRPRTAPSTPSRRSPPRPHRLGRTRPLCCRSRRPRSRRCPRRPWARRMWGSSLLYPVSGTGYRSGSRRPTRTGPGAVSPSSWRAGLSATSRARRWPARCSTRPCATASATSSPTTRSWGRSSTSRSAMRTPTRTDACPARSSSPSRGTSNAWWPTLTSRSSWP